MYIDVSLKVSKEDFEKVEIFNFRESIACEQFTDEFCQCFLNDKPLSSQKNAWGKVLESHCTRAFQKARIWKQKAKPVNGWKR